MTVTLTGLVEAQERMHLASASPIVILDHTNDLLKVHNYEEKEDLKPLEILESTNLKECTDN